MPVSAETRARLSSEQAALVNALMADGALPSGFEAARLGAAAAALARKRSRAASRSWPSLARALGQRFEDSFASYARTTPLSRDGGALEDGRIFARWLAARGELPDAGRLQALAVDLRYFSGPNRLVRRRWPSFRVTWLSRSGRLVVAVRLPRLGERWLSVPIVWRRRAI